MDSLNVLWRFEDTLINALFALFILGLMGAFDTLYFHEYKLKLGAIESATFELKLHGIRDMIYTVLFATIGWIEWNGMYLICFLGLLAAEIIITLIDFREEDRTRQLPPMERSLHASMGIAYGLFLGLIFPTFLVWWSNPSGLRLTYYGAISWILSFLAVGVFISGIRDLVSSKLGKEWPGLWTYLEKRNEL
jgi:hypothetical protein